MMRWKRVLRIALACVALTLSGIGVILLINTWRFKSKQLHVPPILLIPLDESECAARLAAAIQFQTVSHDDPGRIDPEPFLALHEFLEQAFPLVHRNLKREIAGDLSLLFTWEGTDTSRRPVLLMSHIDVVPVDAESEADWSHPPFSGHVADGYVWGRGALDVKCGAVGILEAIEHLLAKGFQPASTVYVALGHDEEYGGTNGNQKIATLLEQRGERLRYVLDEGGAITDGVIRGVAKPAAFVGVAEKGCSNVELKVDPAALGTLEDYEGHGSMPPRQTTIGVLSNAIAKLESHRMAPRIDGATGLLLEYLGPEMPPGQRLVVANQWLLGGLIKRSFSANRATNAAIRTTTAVTMVRGGVSRNVLPGTATATVNVRLLPGDTFEDVLEHIRQAIGDDRVQVSLSERTQPSPVANVESMDFNVLHRTIREVFPNVVVAAGLTAVTTDSRHYDAITDNTFRFIPMRVTDEDLRRIHGTDERIGVKNYLEIVRFFIQLIRNSTS